MIRTTLALLAMTAVIATTHVARAAMLDVDAGVLQKFNREIRPGDIVPLPQIVSVTTTVRRFNSGTVNGNPVGRPVTRTAELPLGTTYAITWTGSTVIPCAQVGFAVPPGELESGPGQYVATASISQSFCAQTGAGDLSITPVTSSAASIGDGGDTAPPPETSSTSPNESVPGEVVLPGSPASTAQATELWSSELEELAAQQCHDGGWRSQLDESGLPYVSEEACLEAKVAEYRERTTSTEQG